MLIYSHNLKKKLISKSISKLFLNKPKKNLKPRKSKRAIKLRNFRNNWTLARLKLSLFLQDLIKPLNYLMKQDLKPEKSKLNYRLNWKLKSVTKIVLFLNYKQSTMNWLKLLNWLKKQKEPKMNYSIFLLRLFLI